MYMSNNYHTNKYHKFTTVLYSDKQKLTVFENNVEQSLIFKSLILLKNSKFLPKTSKIAVTNSRNNRMQ